LEPHLDLFRRVEVGIVFQRRLLVDEPATAVRVDRDDTTCVRFDIMVQAQAQLSDVVCGGAVRGIWTLAIRLHLVEQEGARASVFALRRRRREPAMRPHWPYPCWSRRWRRVRARPANCSTGPGTLPAWVRA